MSNPTVVVRLPAGLRAWSGGQAAIQLSGATVQAVLDELRAEYPDVERRVRDEQGRLRAHVNVFVGADNIRDLDGLQTELAADQQVTILPAVSGGR